MTNNSKRFYLSVLITITGFLALPTNAATFFNPGDIGTSIAVSFNGQVDETVISGLTAEADIFLASVSTDQMTWTFDITLDNTSSSPITASRISMLGFDTDPDVMLNASSASGIFSKIGSGNVPQAGRVEVCANDQNSNCAGGGSAGVLIGDSGNFSMTLVFAEMVSELTLSNYLIRYQSISGTSAGSSGTGFGSEVPVPAAAWLFGSALLGLAGLKRKQS